MLYVLFKFQSKEGIRCQIAFLGRLNHIKGYEMDVQTAQNFTS